jgi:hypothetical protein
VMEFDGRGDFLVLPRVPATRGISFWMYLDVTQPTPEEVTSETPALYLIDARRVVAEPPYLASTEVRASALVSRVAPSPPTNSRRLPRSALTRQARCKRPSG